MYSGLEIHQTSPHSECLLLPALEQHTHIRTSGAVYTLDRSPSHGSDQSVLENSCTVKVSVKEGGRRRFDILTRLIVFVMFPRQGFGQKVDSATLSYTYIYFL